MLKYQKGGSTASPQQQEQLVQLFQAAAKNAQVDPEALVQKAQEVSTDEQSAAQFMQGLQLCAQGDPEGIRFIQGLFKPAYKRGGKIHDFVCKHGKGGINGCGCKQGGGTFKSADKQVTIKNYGTAQADTTGKYSYPSTNGEFQFTPMGRTATVWGNTGGWPIHRYADQNWINRHPRRQMLPGILGGHRQVAPAGFFENLVDRVNNRVPQQESGGNIQWAGDGTKVNKKNKTVTSVNGGLHPYDIEGLDVDPNTLVNTGSTITAFPNKKPYIVNGQVPFNKRNAIWFSLGGVESGSVEDGANIGGVPGRKYRVSQVGGQETNYGEYSNPENFPYIIRYASPVDTLYNVGFQGYNNKSIAFPGIRALYNSAIDSGNIVAQDEASHRELQRQKAERKPKNK